MLVLNLGCGAKTSDLCDNLDWSILIRIKKNPLLRFLASPFLRGDRRERLLGLSDKVILHDMRKGLPYADDSVDVVYHSHMLEHIDRPFVLGFQKEVFRVLRPGGIQRICLPDLEKAVRRYLESIEACEQNPALIPSHDARVAELLEQSVRKEAAGTNTQSGWRRRAEKAILGDARARGETHQWMYDRFNLRRIVEQAGFRDFRIKSWNVSDIPDWEKIGLELLAQGPEYKVDSLYVECRK
jgi:SAM-dependent methyltransferase